MSDGVFVVREQPTGRWIAGCCSNACGFGMHTLADSEDKAAADAAATRHRKQLRTLPALEEQQQEHQAETEDQIGERLAAALVQRRAADPDTFYCFDCDSHDAVVWWLRENAAAVLSAAPGAIHYDEVTEYRVIGEWGTTAAGDEATARDQVRRARAFAPPIEARAEWRTVRTWPDGGRYVGPWQALADGAGT